MLTQNSQRARLERANLHVVGAENRVDAQRILLARLEASGADTVQARQLLIALLNALEVARIARRQVLVDVAEQDAVLRSVARRNT